MENRHVLEYDSCDFATFPEYRELSARLRGPGPNPYFRAHDGIPGATVKIDGREMVDYSSYNYIGLNGHAEVTAAAADAMRRYGTSVSASRIVSGEIALHRELEEEIASFLKTEDSLVLVGGYGANETAIGCLVGVKDLVVMDSLCHASIARGASASKAKIRIFAHNDPEGLEKLLNNTRDRYDRVLIVVEGVYSMDGDICRLPEIIALKKRHRAMLMVDEAHSMGTIGGSGGGVGEYFGIQRRDVDLWMGTLSKSFASCGGYLSGGREIIEYLRYMAPGFVFSVGMPPPAAAAALSALKLLRSDSGPVRRLESNSRRFLEGAKAQGLDTGLSGGAPIVPVIIGNSDKCFRISQFLFQEGINASPIIHPAVEERRARLRFFISSLHEEAQIDRTIDLLAKAVGEA